jgi:hypothetical protein
MYEKTRSQKKSGICCSKYLAVCRCVFAILLSYSAPAQNLPRESWMSSSQTWLKLTVTKPGLYRITGQELKQAGLPLETIAPASLQIFRRERELAIEVESKNSDQLNEQSTITFYGRGNDGSSDSALYVHSGAMPYGKYALYSDTAAYFLTWKQDGGKGKRIAPVPFSTISDTLDYHLQEKETVFNSQYNTGSFYPAGTGFNDGLALTAYDTGEGWTGPAITNTGQDIDINAAGFLPELIETCEITITLVGRAAGKNIAEIRTGTSKNPGRIVAIITLEDYQPQTFRFRLRAEDLEKALIPGNKLSIALHSQKGSSSVSYVRWLYPKNATLKTGADEQTKSFYFAPNLHHTFAKTGATDGWQFYNVTDPFEVVKLISKNSGIEIAGAQHVVTSETYLKPDGISAVRNMPPDLTSCDYLIITHPDLRRFVNGLDAIQSYAFYRSSPAGGNYKTAIVNIQDVYNHYNGGDAGSLGIKKMIAHLSNMGNLKFVFIIGRSVDPQTSRKTSNPNLKDLIPNAGWPGSDIALAMQTDSISPHVPVVAVGRINASQAEEVNIYLQKVKEMEAEPASAPWRKKVLHLSGGRTYKEIDMFRDYLRSYEYTISSSHVAAQVETRSKATEEPVEQFPIHENLNRGAALVTLFGHSGIDVTDIDIGYASDESRNYQNMPFYPAIIANGCALGSIFYTPNTISSDWIFTPDKGAVLFLAHTFNGSSSALKNYTASIYEVLADSAFTSKPFGSIQLEAIQRNLRLHNTLSDIVTSQQMNLHGDPAIRIFPATLPDYTFDSSAVVTSGKNNPKVSTWSDSLHIRIVVHNHGRYNDQPYQLLITDDKKNLIYQATRNAVAVTDTVLIGIKNPVELPGNLHLNAVLDPESKLQEESKHNNRFRIIHTIPVGGVFPVLPVSGFKTNKRNIALVAQLSADLHSESVIFEWDSVDTFLSSQKQVVPTDRFLAKFNLHIPDHYTDIYWRVSVPAYPGRPSVSHHLIFDPEVSAPPLRPEGVAFEVPDNVTQIQEGDSVRCQAIFRNINDIPFSDSLLVKVAHQSPAGTVTFYRKIAPPDPLEEIRFYVSIPTTGFPGFHRLSITFNADKLPEILLQNNQTQFIRHVIPDVSPPLLFVTLDGKMIHDGEEVSASPVLQITLADENPFLTRTDTTGIEVYLKQNCTQCLEKRIWLTTADVKTKFQNQFSIIINDLPALTAGKYTLRVIGHDRSKNRAPAYRIHFQVKEKPSIISFHVAPNPSNTYFRFDVLCSGISETKKMHLVVNEVNGRIIEKKSYVLRSGVNELIWEPVDLPAGIYFYRLEISSSESDLIIEPGFNLNGKLIWMR